MFRIRPEQMNAFEVEDRRRFESRLAGHLEEAYPEVAARHEPRELLDFVHETVDRALAHGIRLENDVVSFAEFTCLLGLAFETRPEHEWAAKILDDPSVSGAEKVERIREELEAFEDELPPGV